MSWQLGCHDMCKIVAWFDNYCWCKSTYIYHIFSRFYFCAHKLYVIWCPGCIWSIMGNHEPTHHNDGIFVSQKTWDINIMSSEALKANWEILIFHNSVLNWNGDYDKEGNINQVYSAFRYIYTHIYYLYDYNLVLMCLVTALTRTVMRLF